MKVVFRLNAEQLERAKRIISRKSKGLQGGVIVGQTLTYSGSHEHFVQGLKPLLAEIYHTTVCGYPIPIEYVPDRPGVQWFETYADYLWMRADWTEFSQNYPFPEIPPRFSAHYEAFSMQKQGDYLCQTGECSAKSVWSDVLRFMNRFKTHECQ